VFWWTGFGCGCGGLSAGAMSCSAHSPDRTPGLEKPAAARLRVVLWSRHGRRRFTGATFVIDLLGLSLGMRALSQGDVERRWERGAGAAGAEYRKPGIICLILQAVLGRWVLPLYDRRTRRGESCMASALANAVQPECSRMFGAAPKRDAIGLETSA
jgi:hypothetical protein